MITETLLPSLGKGQGQPVASEPVPRLNLAPPESGARKIEAGVNALSSWSTIDELTKVHESIRTQTQAQQLAWMLEILHSTSQPYFFLLKQQELSSDVPQFGIFWSQKVTTLMETESAKATLYRGRITGPVKFVNQLLGTWHLGPEKACILLGFEPSRFAYVNGVLQGYETLTGRDAKDRIAHLFQIRKLLSALFRDEAVENEWLREPRDVLKGKTPMDLLLEGSMENLLLVREYVELVTGR